MPVLICDMNHDHAQENHASHFLQTEKIGKHVPWVTSKLFRAIFDHACLKKDKTYISDAIWIHSIILSKFFHRGLKFL